MPHLRADALDDDPEGMAFLKTCLTFGKPASVSSGKTEVRQAIRKDRADTRRRTRPAVVSAVR
jgi:hypothetical protein